MFDFLRRRRRALEIHEEIESHLRMAIDDLIARGKSVREARSEIYRQFGNPDLVRETTRDVWTRRALDELWRDLRLGARNLHQSPLFTLAAIATLALGIGASVAAFTVVKGVVLDRLPYEAPDNLVMVELAFGDQPCPCYHLGLWEIRRRVRGLEAIAIETSRVAPAPEAEEVGPVGQTDFMVTGDYFKTLGVSPALGRFFRPEERYLPDGTRPAVISYGYWQRRWGGRQDVIGQTFSGERGAVMTVIGVVPRRFTPVAYVTGTPRLWTSWESSENGMPNGWFQVSLFGRIRAGSAVHAIQAEVDGVTAGAEPAAVLRDGQLQDARFRVLPLLDLTVTPAVRRRVWIFGLALAMILLIGVLNLVNLQISRIAARWRELSVRLALGASRRRLLQQTLLEAALVSIPGAGLGLLMVYALMGTILNSVPFRWPRWENIAVDGSVVLFAGGVALLAVFAVGILPVLRPSRSELHHALKSDTPTSTETRNQRWFQGAVTVAQTSIAIALLAAAGLFLHSFDRLVSDELGMDLRNVTSVEVTVPQRYTPAERVALARRLLDEIRGLDDVEAAAASDGLPYTAFAGFVAEGDAGNFTEPRHVSEEYARTVGLPLRRGRWIDKEDLESRALVAVVSEEAARRLWGSADPIGKRFLARGAFSNRLPLAVEVIGVSADVRHRPGGEPVPFFYVPFGTDLGAVYPPTAGGLVLAIRSSRAVTSQLRRPITALILAREPESRVNLGSLKERIVGSEWQTPRFRTIVVAGSAAVAILLAMLGVFSIVASTTAQRTREAGICLALGAGRHDIVLRMMRRGLIPAFGGIVMGLAIAVTSGRILETYLFEIEPTDLRTYAEVLVVAFTLTSAAAWLPARRAARIDPVAALRHE
jgi:putative ABC transport system permease protein